MEEWGREGKGRNTPPTSTMHTKKQKKIAAVGEQSIDPEQSDKASAKKRKRKYTEQDARQCKGKNARAEGVDKETTADELDLHANTFFLQKINNLMN